ncbi:MAG: DUF5717 family protein [Defluviitaleaceae bacterium]|nr:DUF5717 family protein [Defluviitaleaceae bacterium]
MQTDERFEYPLPLLSADIENISISTSAACEGSFTIRNSGGGALSGTITSNTGCVAFSPRNFEGNSVRINYSFAPGVYRAGESIRTGALIMSNGGEKLIPITIVYTPPALTAPDGGKIANLRDFMAFCRVHPEEAGDMFSGPDFRRFLADIGYGYINAYERIVDDPDKSRALENFFVLSGLKTKNGLSVLQNKFEIPLKPNDMKVVSGSIPLERTGWGYLNVPVFAKRGVPWLTFVKRVKNADFKDGNAAALSFAVDPKEVKAGWDAENVIIGNEDPISVEISVRKLPPIEAWVSREFYGMEDGGLLTVVNQTGADLLIEVVPMETFVKFAGLKYLVGEKADIPFQVRFSAFQTAPLIFRKQPFAEAFIEISANADGKRIKKRVKIAAGEW